MKKTTLQVQMKGIGNLAVRMSDFHMLNIRNSSMHFIEQQTGKLEMCVLNIHDTINALDYYVSQKKVMHQGERYLLICGAFQSLFIQQDTISFLREIMLPESGKIDWKVEFPELDKIRNYRNRYFGHPTEGKSKNSFHVGSLQPTSDSLEKIELLKMQCLLKR